MQDLMGKRKKESNISTVKVIAKIEIRGMMSIHCLLIRAKRTLKTSHSIVKERIKLQLNA